MPLLETLTRVRRAFVERRRATRYETRCPAWIEFDDAAPPRYCTLVDVSDGGARIEVPSTDDLPEEFSLVLMDDAAHIRRCRIMWRGETQVGVRYLEPYVW